MDSRTGSPTKAVQLVGLSKNFGPFRALAGVNLDVRAGTIHGVVGENGAGKSTTMNILSGMMQPTSGSIFVEGKKRKWQSVRDAMEAGIGMVHQHFQLSEAHSGLDNIILANSLGTGFWRSIFSSIPRDKTRQKLERLMKMYGLDVDLEKKVGLLSVGECQRLEILKLLAQDASILIFDEPTAVLSPDEIKDFFANLRRLRDEGKTVLIITHKLSEVIDITDEVSVFRKGKLVGQTKTADASKAGLAAMMMGKTEYVPAVIAAENTVHQLKNDQVVVSVKDLQLRAGSGVLTDVNFEIRRGEVLGIAGVEGNGQCQLMDALLHPVDLFQGGRASGRIDFKGHDITGLSHQQIRKLGVGVVYPDRFRQGIIASESLRTNYLLGYDRAEQNSRFGLLRHQSISDALKESLTKYDVRPVNPGAVLGHLSGGNQQKFVIGRELDKSPDILIMSQPTRGVDIGAIEHIHRLIKKAVDQGCAVLLISSELSELRALADRIMVMYRGGIVATFDGDDCCDTEIGYCMGGMRKMHGS